jgi:hypothetical protein
VTADELNLADFTVFVSATHTVSEQTTVCAQHAGPIHPSVAFSCNASSGQFLSIQNGHTHPAYHQFALCEVVVIGTPDDGKYSSTLTSNLSSDFMWTS